MIKRLMPFLCALLAFVSAPAFAQSVQRASLSGQALALSGGGQTVPAAETLFTFAPSPKFDLGADVVLAPANDFQAYMGKLDWSLDQYESKLGLDSKTFDLYVTGEMGIDRIVHSTGPVAQHLAFAAGAGLKYDPTGKGNFTLTLGEVKWARFPGLQNNTVMFATGATLNF